MNLRRALGVLAGGVIVGATAIVGGSAPVGAVGPCNPTPTRTLSGAQTAFTSTLAANEHVNATNATWTGTTSYPAYFDSTADSCWDGGRIKGTFSATTSWNTFHGNNGFGVSGSNFTLNGVRIFNYGDGIRIRDNADGFKINDAYLGYIHDDCIENDRLVNGTITNSYLDGCYVGISARRSAGDTQEGQDNTVTIRNSLIRLQAMPTVYSGDAGGHGGFFKWDENAPVSPKLDISNTIFRADQDTNHGSLSLPAGYPVTCSNNTMVWLGTGSFPGSLPSCFTVTTDRSVWDSAARAWDVAHPGVISGPEVSIGDASIIEGSSGTRLLRFPLSLSTAPGSGNPVTVYWTTVPGSANTNDFVTKKGKVTFTGSQVFKMVSAVVRPDTSNESNEQMYLAIAGVDGGEHHRERGTGSIVNDDPGSGVRLAVSDSLLVEGDGGTRTLIVPIALTLPAAADVMINWSTVAGSAAAGSDFTQKTANTKIAAGRRFVYLSIPILSDTTSEGTETFQIVVNSATNATVMDGTGVVTIRDDD